MPAEARVKIFEFDPVDVQEPVAIHREDSFVLTCALCGCRLTPRESLADGGEYGPDAAWRHFWGGPGKDARGCRVECMDLPHRIRPE
jgi:hypothetical protein